MLGTYAPELGSKVPGRLAPILPWGAPQEVPRVSPLDASASYLAYVRSAWNHQIPDHPLEDQEIVLTVPAARARTNAVRSSGPWALGPVIQSAEPVRAHGHIATTASIHASSSPSKEDKETPAAFRYSRR